MTEDELAAIVDGIGPVIRDYVGKLTQRVDAVERELAVIVAKPHVKFCGVWAAGSEYIPGDAVTYQGGLWICKAPTPGKPHEDFVGWQLAVKRGAIG